MKSKKTNTNTKLLLYQRLLSLIEEEKRQEPSPFLFSKIETKLNTLKLETENWKLNNRLPVFAGYLKPLFISVCIVIGIIIGVIAGNNLNIKNNSGKNITNTTNITSSSTKGFYLYGVDDEAI